MASTPSSTLGDCRSDPGPALQAHTLCAHGDLSPKPNPTLTAGKDRPPGSSHLRRLYGAARERAADLQLVPFDSASPRQKPGRAHNFSKIQQEGDGENAQDLKKPQTGCKAPPGLRHRKRRRPPAPPKIYHKEICTVLLYHNFVKTQGGKVRVWLFFV